MSAPYLVGITGGSASGKTLLLQELKKSFGENELCVISQDNYYLPIGEQTYDQNNVVNFDLPESIDHSAFAHDVTTLKMGNPIHRKEYTFNNPNAKENILTTHPATVIIVEGIFVFHLKEIRDQLDLKVFVDARDDIMLARRIKRDAEERGYDMADVTYRFENHVKPTFKKFIEPYKKQADFLISNNEMIPTNVFTEIIDFLEQKIKGHP